MIDALAFGTGLHPTTALCLEARADIVERAFANVLAAPLIEMAPSLDYT